MLLARSVRLFAHGCAKIMSYARQIQAPQLVALDVKDNKNSGSRYEHGWLVQHCVVNLL